MKSKILTLLIVLCSSCGSMAVAQQVAIKTNVLYWATTTPNLSVEIATGRRTTLDLSGQYNPFEFGNDRKVKNAIFQPEFRIWNCEKFNRGFWGAHALGGVFNAANIELPLDIFSSLKGHRFQGVMFGGGVSYGYQWYLGPHWNLEATIGFGYAYLDYEKFLCGDCAEKITDGHKHYFGPTKIGVTFVYLFRSKK